MSRADRSPADVTMMPGNPGLVPRTAAKAFANPLATPLPQPDAPILPRQPPTLLRHPSVRLGDRRTAPSLVDGNRFEYLLPPWRGTLFIDSHATCPAVLRPGDTDRRYLGLAVCRLRVRSPTDAVEIALDSAALGDGWWPIERRDATSYRWTNGHAALTLPDTMQKGAILEVTVCAHAPVP
jgi:hypothetical protein